MLKNISVKSLIFLLLILIGILFSNIAQQATASPSISMHVKVLNALTGEPIENAMVIILDLRNPTKPMVGNNIFFTNEEGECNISKEYLKSGNTYWVYAYRGDPKEKKIDFVPVKKEIRIEGSNDIDLTLSLVPGALVELESIPYIVQASSLQEGNMIIRVISKKEDFNFSFLNEYGDAIDVFYLGLDRKMIPVPANLPFDIEVSVSIVIRERERVSEIFYIRNGTQPFMMQQGGYTLVEISGYSLKRGVEYVGSILVRVSSMLSKAQEVGFTVFEEWRTVERARQQLMEADTLLSDPQAEKDYEKIWLTLRGIIGEMNFVAATIESKYLIGKTNAIYLSGMIAIFSTVLAFFFFESTRKKVLSLTVIYIILLCVMYFINPGTHVIIDENISLFSISAAVSFAIVSAIVFGIPRVWKERNIEGEVQWRSALSVIFSMSKRQIKRKKIRGFFTIFSICMLILAFTALTTFGTAFGIISYRTSAVPSSDGILIRRMVNGSSLIFSPLGIGDATTLSKLIHVTNVAQRMKNIPKSDPVARLINPTTGNSYPVYGIFAISPNNESVYTRLNEVVEGDYLSENRFGEALIGLEMAEKLGLKIGSNVTLEISGTSIMESIIVKGFLNDEGYEALTDVDGNPLGPARLLQDSSARRCNASEIIVINLETAKKIQDEINNRYGVGALQFTVPSEIIFQSNEDVEAVVRSIISLFGYDVFVSSNGAVNYYYIGAYIRFDGTAELLIPLIMVVLSVGMVMTNSVYERGKEIKLLSTLGLNPTHIGLMFLAEAIVMGMVGGSIGYLAGLGFYRTLVFLGQNLVENLMVREKLEWWWSALGFTFAVVISIISAVRPTAMAIRAYTPSMIKKVRRPEKAKKEREEKIFKVYRAREVSMPLKVSIGEKEFFIGFFLDYLKQLRTGYMERVENIEDIPEAENANGELEKIIKFNYYPRVKELGRGTRNSLVLTRKPDEEYYRVKLVTEPVSPGLPENIVDKTIDFVHWILMQWVKDKKGIMGGT
jgi:ABC-type antimicrobial peptide transport system permease subunit